MSRHGVQCTNCLSGVPVLDAQVPASNLVLQALLGPGRLPKPAGRDLVGAPLRKMMVPPSGSELVVPPSGSELMVPPSGSEL